MNTRRVSSAACVQQLRPVAPRARAFSPDSKGVTRGVFQPAYKVRRFEREVRVHAHIERFGPVTDWSAA